MFDINAIVNAAINAAVNARLTEVLQQHANTMGALTEQIHNLDAICQAQAERIAALETKLTEAKLFEQTNNVTIPIDEAKMVEALNSQEWFWEKLQNRIDAATEQAVDDHCGTYDHDNYAEMASKVDDMPDFDDFVKDGDMGERVREYVEDALNNASVSFSI